MEDDDDDHDVSVYVEGLSLNPGTKKHVGAYAVWSPTLEALHGAWWVDSKSEPGGVTNQKMELMAALAGLEAINTFAKHNKEKSMRYRLVTSSSYVICCMIRWLPRWLETGWVTKLNRPVQNGEVLKRMAVLKGRYDVDFVKGDDPDKMGRVRQKALEAARKGEDAVLAMHHVATGFSKRRLSTIAESDAV